MDIDQEKSVEKVIWQFKVLEGMTLKQFFKLKKRAFDEFTLVFKTNYIHTPVNNTKGVNTLLFYTCDVKNSFWGTTRYAIDLTLPFSDYGKTWIVLNKL